MNETEERVARVVAAIGPIIQRALCGAGNTTVGEVARAAIAAYEASKSAAVEAP